MPDYKKLYFQLFRATEGAVRLLIAAQQSCEELYLSAPEPDLTLTVFPSQQERGDGEKSPPPPVKPNQSSPGT